MSWNPATWAKTAFDYLTANFPIAKPPKNLLGLSSVGIAGVGTLAVLAMWKMDSTSATVVVVVASLVIWRIVAGGQELGRMGMGKELHSPEEQALARQIDAATKHEYGQSSQPRSRKVVQSAIGAQAPEGTTPLPPMPTVAIASPSELFSQQSPEDAQK
ncbi:MAG: hypothetical protein ABIQ47_00060 [Tepidiformaceae bacterium]